MRASRDPARARVLSHPRHSNQELRTRVRGALATVAAQLPSKGDSMMRASVAVLVLALVAVGCGDDEPSDGGGPGGGGRTLTVYSSLPLQGAQRPQTTDMVKGIELALEQAGGKAGEFTVKYESLDDSTAQAGSWTPEATTANARKAAQDDSTAV